MRNLLKLLTQEVSSNREVAGLSGLSRISEELRKNEQQGLRNLPWKPLSESPLAPRLVDMNWLAAQPLLPYLVNHIPAPLLYQSLVAHGLEDSIEVIEHLRGEQLVKVLDFDVWNKDASESGTVEFEPKRFLDWVRAWFEIDPDFAAERFLELDEEIIILAMQGLLKIYPEGLSRPPAEEKADEYWTTTDGRFHLKVIDDAPESFELVHALVDALYRKDVKLAQSVLSHSAMLVHAETLEDGLKWRDGRLSDAGFVSKEEAADFLKPLPKENIEAQVRNAVQMEGKRTETVLSDSAFETEYATEIEMHIRVLEKLPEDELQRTVVHSIGEERLLLWGNGRALSPVEIAEDEDVLQETAEAIAEQCTQLLSAVNVAPLKRAHSKLSLSIELALAFIAEEDIEEAASLKARVARVANTFLAATANGFDADGSLRAIAVVRGAMNVGLDVIVKNGWLEIFESGSNEEGYAHALRAVGPEFLFKLGWSEIARLPIETAHTLEELGLAAPTRYGSLAKKFEIRFDDGASLSMTLSQLISKGRFVEARNVLFENEEKLSPALYSVLNSLLNRVPLFHEALSSQDKFRTGTQRKTFETLQEVETALNFIVHLHNNAELENN